MTFQLGQWGAAESFYRSWGHQPFQFWILQGLFLVWLIARRKHVRDWRWLALFTATSALDAWLTTDTVPGVGRLSSFWAQWLGIAFVIIGDLRLFWFLQPSKPVHAIAFAFVTPVLSALMRAIPSFPTQNMRVVFFAYEVTFVAVLAGLLWAGTQRGSQWKIFKDFGIERVRRLSAFAFIYYGLWIVADALLLNDVSGAWGEFAWAVRLIANLFYYGGLLPWIVVAR